MISIEDDALSNQIGEVSKEIEQLNQNSSDTIEPQMNSNTGLTLNSKDSNQWRQNDKVYSKSINGFIYEQYIYWSDFNQLYKREQNDGQIIYLEVNTENNITTITFDRKVVNSLCEYINVEEECYKLGQDMMYYLIDKKSTIQKQFKPIIVENFFQDGQSGSSQDQELKKTNFFNQTLDNKIDSERNFESNSNEEISRLETTDVISHKNDSSEFDVPRLTSSQKTDEISHKSYSSESEVPILTQSQEINSSESEFPILTQSQKINSSESKVPLLTQSQEINSSDIQSHGVAQIEIQEENTTTTEQKSKLKRQRKQLSDKQKIDSFNRNIGFSFNCQLIKHLLKYLPECEQYLSIEILNADSKLITKKLNPNISIGKKEFKILKTKLRKYLNRTELIRITEKYRDEEIIHQYNNEEAKKNVLMQEVNNLIKFFEQKIN